jgi:hypothetical protein
VSSEFESTFDLGAAPEAASGRESSASLKALASGLILLAAATHLFGRRENAKNQGTSLDEKESRSARRDEGG